MALLAFLLREYYVLVAVVESPLSGDVRQYVAYAWNLLHHGVFSHAWPGSGTPAPDAFRSPGYPAFLAACMWAAGETGNWSMLAIQAQVLLGTATCLMTMLLGRHWLPDGLATWSGVMIAIWPHHIAATGALLGEVLFGFVLLAALWLTAIAFARRQARWMLPAGIAYACAALVNPIAVAFPVIAALMASRDCRRRLAVLLLAASMAAPGLWAMRNATLPPADPAPGRIAMNLVQGSWPQYHRAWLSAVRDKDPTAQRIMHAIDQEERLLASDPGAGASRMFERMSGDPGYYLRWYFLEKPFLLWDWDIRLGAGDVYFHRVHGSPLESNRALKAVKDLLQLLNPAIFALSALGSGILLSGWLRRAPWAPAAAAMVAASCIYVTVVHAVFQAEPRYSIAYRPMQLIMLSGMALLLARQAWRLGMARP